MNVVKNILFAALVVAASAYTPVLATGFAPSSAPPCCAKGDCCASGPCCDMPGCCKADKSCCDPKTGACTSACGCAAMNCCGGAAKKAGAKSRGHFVTEGKRTFWIPGSAPAAKSAQAPASCCDAASKTTCAAPCCAKK